jgi:hypothetical protein
MSLYTFRLSFLTLRPSVREDGRSLVIKTGFLARLCSLFLRLRRVEVLPDLREVRIVRRMGYLLKSAETLSFDDIWYVDYSFGAFGTSWGWTAGGYGRHDQVETFSVSLVTRDERPHYVCSFRGEGAVGTGWTGVLLGDDDWLDLSGTQEAESRKFVDYLARLIGVSVGKPASDLGRMATCPECGRPTSLYNPKCMYCGAQVE